MRRYRLLLVKILRGFVEMLLRLLAVRVHADLFGDVLP